MESTPPKVRPLVTHTQIDPSKRSNCFGGCVYARVFKIFSPHVFHIEFKYAFYPSSWDNNWVDCIPSLLVVVVFPIICSCFECFAKKTFRDAPRFAMKPCLVLALFCSFGGSFWLYNALVPVLKRKTISSRLLLVWWMRMMESHYHEQSLVYLQHSKTPEGIRAEQWSTFSY